MTNLKIRFKLTENNMRYWELDKILGISEPTRCRMLRNELPDEEKDRICKLIDKYITNKDGRSGKRNERFYSGAAPKQGDI